MTELSLRIWSTHEYCPKCGGVMVKRIPKPGDDWTEFYSCRDWPLCPGTLPINQKTGEVWVDPLEDLSWI